MKTIQKKLAERIYEILPHKKELEFGCELKDGGNFPIICFDSKTFIYKGNSEIMNTQDVLDWIELGDIEIIGQPLTLASFLLTFSKKYKSQTGVAEFSMDVVYQGYNLSQDNILSQSDDFCEWALQILK